MINKLIFGTASLTNISDYNKIINLLECTYDHGIINYDTANLYVLGASVFPTSGYANTGLSSLALTVKLSDYL